MDFFGSSAAGLTPCSAVAGTYGLWLNIMVQCAPIWNIPSSNTSRETACLVCCFLWVCLVSPGKCRNDNARLIHNCFHPTVIMFTFRTRFLFSVSLNNGKIEMMVWDGGGTIFSVLILYLPQRYCLTTDRCRWHLLPTSRRREENCTRNNENV